MWINRRLYLESPIEIQELLILPYMLGSIVTTETIETIVRTSESTGQ
jgi:hypothetical protein